MTAREREAAVERLAALSDEGLAAALVDLGRSLTVPDAGDLSSSVVRRLEKRRHAGRSGSHAWPRWPANVGTATARLRPALLVALIAALVIAGVAAALGLGLPGIRITFGPGPSAPSAIPSAAPSAPRFTAPSSRPAASPSTGVVASAAIPGAGLSLGRPAALADARAGAGYQVGVPSLAGLGPPGAVWLDSGSTPPVVSLAWKPAAGARAVDGVGLLLSEVPGSIETDYFGKFLGSGTTIVPVAVGDGGWWITGDLHEVALLGPDGNVRLETVRLAGNVLLWSSGGVTFRLETSLDQAGALAIARSVH